MALHCPRLSELPPPPPGKSGWPWTEESLPLPDTMPDGTPWPRISIVTPSYNQGPFIEETLRSVLLQGYPNLEYVVIDGGSTDESTEVINKYAPWLSYWVSEPDRGQSHAINKGLDRATGKLYGWLCSDDYFKPGALRVLAEMSSRSPEAVAWVGQCEKVDVTGAHIEIKKPRHLKSAEDIADWGHRGQFYQPASLFSAQGFAGVGGVDETLHYVMDVDLWVRMVQHGSFATTDSVLAAARDYPSNKTNSDVYAREAEVIHVALKNGLPRVAARRLQRLIGEGLGLSDQAVFELLTLRVKKAVAKRMGRTYRWYRSVVSK